MACMRRSSKRLPKDENRLAYEIVKLSTEESPVNEAVSKYLARIGREGGKKGGKIRAERLSSAKRAEIASKAAKARWKTRP